MLSVTAAGTSYTGVAALNFTNHSHLYDTASKTLNIGQYLYQSFLRLGSGAQNGDLTNVAGDLTWDGAPLAKYSDLSSKQDTLDFYSESLTNETTIL